jgi:hypothetical protein
MTTFAAAYLIVWLAMTWYLVQIVLRQRRMLRVWRQRTTLAASDPGRHPTIRQQDHARCC